MQAALITRMTPYAMLNIKACVKLPVLSNMLSIASLRYSMSVFTLLERMTPTRPVKMPVMIMTRFFASVSPEYLQKPTQESDQNEAVGAHTAFLLLRADVRSQRSYWHCAQVLDFSDLHANSKPEANKRYKHHPTCQQPTSCD